MEEVEEDVVVAKRIDVRRTTPTFLVASQISTVTPTGDVTTCLAISRGKQTDIKMQQ